MIELINKRSYNAKTFKKIELDENGNPILDENGEVVPVLDNGKQVYVTIPHTGHIHYSGTDNVLKDVDFTLEDKGAYWQMVKASYKIFIAKDFGANKLIKFQNRYRGANHEIIYEPRMLAWVNKTDLSDFSVFRNQQSVQGYITDEGNVIRYDNAFGNGLHFKITLLSSGFKKEIVIEAKNKLELPPTSNHKLVTLFEYSGTGLKVKANDKLRQWTSGNYFEETGGFRIQEETNEASQSFIQPAYIIDDGAETPTQENIKVFWKQHNGKLFQAKVLPTQFLKNAVYPVRADTVTSFYPGSDESLTSSASSWSSTRDATTATVRTGTSSYVFTFKSTVSYYCERYFSTINTSGLTAGASILGASYVVLGINKTGTGSRSYNIYDSNHSDTVQASDFDLCGSTAWATAITQSAFSGSGINTWTLNATGLAGINKTGNTKLCIREVLKDVANSAPTDDNQYVGFSNIESANDPYLEITYTEGDTYELLADNGTFSLTGKAIVAAFNRVLAAVKGAFVLTGNAIITAFNRVVQIARGTFESVGYVVALAYSGDFTYIILMAKDSFALTANTIVLAQNKVISLANEIFVSTGLAVGLARGRNLIADNGAYILTGINTILAKMYTLTIVKGVFALTGNLVDLITAITFETLKPKIIKFKEATLPKITRLKDKLTPKIFK